MIRSLAVLMALGMACSAMANEPIKALPQGTWRRPVGDGGSWTLTLDGKGAKWVGQGPEDKGAMTITFIAPVCILAEDGKLAYGYTTRMTWVKGDESADRSSPNPFAFTFKVDGDNLEIADFKMTGIPENYPPWLSGTFTKVPPEETAQVPKAPRTLER